MRNIPLFSAGREFEIHRKEIMARIEADVVTGDSFGGPSVIALERRLGLMSSRKHAVAVASGTDALFFALQASGIVAGDEVVVTDFSFISSASAITMASALPVFVD